MKLTHEQLVFLMGIDVQVSKWRSLEHFFKTEVGHWLLMNTDTSVLQAELMKRSDAHSWVRSHPELPLCFLKLEDLRVKARELGIQNYTRKTKEELADEIRSSRRDPDDILAEVSNDHF